MTCESVRKQLSLYLYGELSFDGEEAVAQHLDGCAGCAEALDRERRMQRAVDMGELVPPVELLDRCRLELPRALRQTAMTKQGWLDRIRLLAFPRGLFAARWLRPVGAVALVAIGFFAARFITTDAGANLAAPFFGGSASPPATTHVRLVEPSGKSGGVRIVVDETRQRVLSGSVEDDRIRGLLLTALRNPSDPGVRAESVEVLKNRQHCEDTKQALLYTLENDPNDGVRLKALEGLRPYATDPDSRRVLSRALLHDDNPGVRTMAVELLIQSDDVDVVETLQELLRREDNNYLRLRCQKALQNMNASVETF